MQKIPGLVVLLSTSRIARILLFTCYSAAWSLGACFSTALEVLVVEAACLMMSFFCPVLERASAVPARQIWQARDFWELLWCFPELRGKSLGLLAKEKSCNTWETLRGVRTSLKFSSCDVSMRNAHIFLLHLLHFWVCIVLETTCSSHWHVT